MARASSSRSKVVRHLLAGNAAVFGVLKKVSSRAADPLATVATAEGRPWPCVYDTF
jgi:hypothetical protein